MHHLVLISTSYPSGHDGSEAAGSFVADFVHALAKYIRVSVVAPDIQSGVEIVSESIEVHRFAVPRLPLSLLTPARPSSWPATVATLVSGYKTLDRLIKQRPVDHIFALWALPSGYWAMKAGARFGIPYSIWALGSDIWTLGRVPVVKRILRQVLRDSRYNFADGFQLQKDVEELARRPCIFLPSTRELGSLPVPSANTQPPYTLAFLGRWHPNKGIDLLLAALQELTDRDWQRIAEVRIAGGGPMQIQVHRLCSDLQAQGHPLVLQGYLGKQAAVRWFSSADYVLIPSRIESIPVVFSDAVKCGCPVIAMPVGDFPRLMEQYGVGQLSKTVTTAGFCEAIRCALADSPVNYVEALERVSEAFSVTHSASVLHTRLFGSVHG